MLKKCFTKVVPAGLYSLKIPHNAWSLSFAFSDISGSNLDDYKFLDTEWNKESMNTNKVGRKGEFGR